MRFSKPYKTFAEQIEIFESRGLTFCDKSEAERFLSYTNYYRFTGYLIPYESQRDSVLPGTTFEMVRLLYEFDRQLRSLVMEGISVIEIFTRTKIAVSLAERHGPFAHLDPAIFYLQNEFKNWQEHIKKETLRSQETFVRHFKQKYDEWPNLPIWVVVELMTFGSVSQLFKILTRKEQKNIARRFPLSTPVLESWLHVLSYVRNLCAHHSRFWNREISIAPEILKVPSWHLFDDPLHTPLGAPLYRNKPFCVLTIIRHLLEIVASRTGMDISWHGRILQLLNAAPAVPHFERRMGIPTGWRQSVLWA